MPEPSYRKTPEITPLPGVLFAPPAWPEIEHLDPRTEIAVTPSVGWYAGAKGLCDYILALVILVPALPVMFAAWAAIRLTSPGPGFYSQTRLGRGGRPYKILKIRSMRLDAEAGGAQWAHGKHDARVTRVGKFLRMSHFDELPQLFNVLKGDMSLVGPRPERPEMIARKGLDECVPGYRHRLMVKPGVTGLAQVQLPADSDLNSVRHKVVYDLYYIEHVGLWLDLRVLAATLLKAAGVPMKVVRRVFFFPTRDAVAARFRENIADDSQSYAALQPV